MQLTRNERDSLIQAWRQSQQDLAIAKEREARLRRDVLLYVYDYNGSYLREGTDRIELGSGYALRAMFKVNYKLDTAKTFSIAHKIADYRQDGKEIVSSIFKWKPELVPQMYKLLPYDVKGMVNSVLTTLPAATVLEFIEPKR